jgi:hypothetical protein
MKNLYILFLLCSFTIFSQSPGDIIITEILQNPTGTDGDGEYFELYNTTSVAINIDGWTIKDLDAANPDQHVIDNGGTLNIPANGYITLGRNGDTGLNGGITHSYIYGDDMALGNTTDELVLETPSMIIIDQVIYDDGATFPDPNGPSMQLDLNVLDATDNDSGSNWCESTANYGTPGVANEVCPTQCVAGLGASDSACDTVTMGETSDTYTATLAYFSAATGETFVVTSTFGSIDLSGGNPTSDENGTITVTGIPEGTDITITIDNTGDNGVCLLTRAIISPACEPTGSIDLQLRGVIDFGIPGSSGKAIHLVAKSDVEDLSAYGLGSANNGTGSDGVEYTFDAIEVNAGDNILVVRDLISMEAYLTVPGYDLFDLKILVAGAPADGNGNDAIELFKFGVVVETYGEITYDDGAASWSTENAWAYKELLGSEWPIGWIYGAEDCSIGTTTFESDCVYPFLSSLSTEDFNANELSIYPNPTTSGIVNIKSQIAGVKTVSLFDIMGRTVLNKQLNSDILDVSSIKTGLYLLQISINGRSSVTKLVIN